MAPSRSSGNTHATHYRPDIDGLRAVAVGLVLLFHAFPTYLPGGFVGVDVFFVISGFLISGIILREVEGNTFSIQRFYERRVRRIFPALIVTMAACLIFGLIAMFPDELTSLAKHVLGGGSFVANLVYWSESGYFDHAAESKPLLHLWSLGVEEQFYLVWPWVIWLTVRRRWRHAWVFLLAGAASFAVNMATVYTDSTAAFYSPASRVWEMILGSMCALVARTPSDSRRAIVLSNAASLMGACLLAASVWLISKNRPFPGVWALLPSLGACLLILGGPKAEMNARILSNRTMVWVGLISFPLYLWHWPLLVALHTETGVKNAPLANGTALGLAVLLAWMTYRFVETPLRHRQGRAVVAGLILAMAALLAAAGAVMALNGLPARLPAELSQAYQNNQRQLEWQNADQACLSDLNLPHEALDGQLVFCRTTAPIDQATVAILGDSTANALFPGMATLAQARPGQQVINIGNGSCPPFLGVEGLAPWNRQCAAITQAAYQRVMTSPKIHTVVMSLAAWDLDKVGLPGVASDAPAAQRHQAMQRVAMDSIHALKTAGKRVILAYDTPNLGVLPMSCISRPLGLNGKQCARTEAQLEHRQPYLSHWDAILQPLRQDVCIFSPSSAMRSEADGLYRVQTPDGTLLLRDTHHLSMAGSLMVAHSLERQCRAF